MLQHKLLLFRTAAGTAAVAAEVALRSNSVTASQTVNQQARRKHSASCRTLEALPCYNTHVDIAMQRLLAVLIGCTV